MRFRMDDGHSFSPAKKRQTNRGYPAIFIFSEKKCKKFENRDDERYTGEILSFREVPLPGRAIHILKGRMVMSKIVLVLCIFLLTIGCSSVTYVPRHEGLVELSGVVEMVSSDSSEAKPFLKMDNLYWELLVSPEKKQLRDALPAYNGKKIIVKGRVDIGDEEPTKISPNLPEDGIVRSNCRLYVDSINQ